MRLGFTKFTQLHVVTSYIESNVRIAHAGCRTGTRHAAHYSLALAHVALTPQVEFELLEGVQQQNTSGQDIR